MAKHLFELDIPDKATDFTVKDREGVEHIVRANAQISGRQGVSLVAKDGYEIVLTAPGNIYVSSKAVYEARQKNKAGKGMKLQ